MSYSAQRTAIGDRFYTQWAIGNPVSPTPEIAWPNVEFTPPTNAPWVRYALRTGGESLSAGASNAGLFSNGGVIFISIFTPKGENSSRATALADHAAGIYRGQVFSDIEIYDIQVSEGTPEDAWYSMTVQVQYIGREVHSI